MVMLMTSRTQAIGRRVFTARKRAGLTQGQLATFADVSRTWVTRLEQGDFGEVSEDKLRRVARVLSCTVADLTGQADEVADKVPVLLDADEAADVAPFIRLPAWARRVALAAGHAVRSLDPVEEIPDAAQGIGEGRAPQEGYDAPEDHLPPPPARRVAE